jgi:hypothetical protein
MRALDGEIAVTGGNSGIGPVPAKRFVEEGAWDPTSSYVTGSDPMAGGGIGQV